MLVASQIVLRIASLVHPRARDCPVEHTRHLSFMTSRLTLSLAVLSAVPMRLVFGIPQWWEAVAVLFLQLPLVAVFHLSRGGCMRASRALSAIGLLLCGCVLSFADTPWSVLAVAMMTLAVLEMTLAQVRQAVLVLSGLGGLTVLAFALSPAWAGSTGSGPLALAGWSIGLASVFAYAIALAWGATTAANVHARRADIMQAEQHAVLSAIGSLVLDIDRRGVVAACRSELAALPTLTAGDIVGRGFYERIHLLDRPAYLHAIANAFDGLQNQTTRVRLRTGTAQSGRGAFLEPVYATIEIRACRVATPDAHVSATALCLIADVSEQRNREDDAFHAKQIGDLAAQSRDRFLANVSHELRTPLNAVIGFAELLGTGVALNNHRKQKEYADIISASGHHLLSVVNSILDMSQMEAGSLELAPSSFEPAPVIDACIDMVKLKAEQNEVTIVRDYDSVLAPIVADERASRQILINLLSNAVKFTPKGGTVTIRARSDLGLALTIKDTGIGIAAADLPQLGKAFFQASNTRSRLFEGTGLGLSLVRGLVGLHGGTIEVTSAPGSGTTVDVHLPQDCRSGTLLRMPVAIRSNPHSPDNPINTIEKVRQIA